MDESKLDQNKINEFTSLSEESNTKSIVSIILDLKVIYKGSDDQSISFIKRQQVATINLKESKKEIGSQIQVLNFGYVGEEINLFRLTNIYVDDGLIPLFTSFKSKKSKDYAN